MPHLLTILLIVYAVALTPVHAAIYKYWIHQSCKERPQWNGAFEEAKFFAAWVQPRLWDPNDYDFANAFKRVFMTDKLDTTTRSTELFTFGKMGRASSAQIVGCKLITPPFLIVLSTDSTS
jgi:hypothetical protein